MPETTEQLLDRAATVLAHLSNQWSRNKIIASEAGRTLALIRQDLAKAADLISTHAGD